jgi:hypothetical protein
MRLYSKRVLAVASMATLAAMSMVGASSAKPPPGVLVTLDTPGVYTFTVPDKVSSLTFEVSGAEGGAVDDGADPATLIAQGGRGGLARGTFAVKSGDVFQIVVGGRGGNAHGTTPGAGGFNGGGGGLSGGTASDGNFYFGGGGGGGASDVRSGPCALTASCGLGERIVVGGGGGGAGGTLPGPVSGGGGGGLEGAAGEGIGGGLGGTQTSGGGCPIPSGNTQTDGSFGIGGPGNGFGASGGGGGWYGGAGSCTSSVLDPAPGSEGHGSGGGGGSGFISPTAKNRSTFPGGSATHGRVVISTP